MLSFAEECLQAVARIQKRHTLAPGTCIKFALTHYSPDGKIARWSKTCDFIITDAAAAVQMVKDEHNQKESDKCPK